MVTVFSDVTVTTSVPYLLPLGSGRDKWGGRYVFGRWGREVISGGYLRGSRDWGSGFLSVMGFVRSPSLWGL